jgi:O-antigen ligase
MFVFILSQLFRDRIFLTLFVRWFLVFSIFAFSILAYLQLSQVGLQELFSYDSLKSAKYELQGEKSIGLNSFSYSIGTAMLIASGLISWPRISRRILLLSLIVMLWIFASTTTIASLGLAVVSTVLMHALIRQLRFPAKATSLALLVLWLSAPLVMILVAQHLLNATSEVNELTTGRIFVWLVALQEFLANPIFGAGPFSWLDSLVSGVAELSDDITRYELITGGAYHNVLLTTLAERGIIGGLTVTFLAWLVLLRCTNVLAMSQRSGQANLQHHLVEPSVVVVATMLTLIRGIGEYSGPFAYAYGHTDFVGLSVIALLLSTNSIETLAPGRLEPKSTHQLPSTATQPVR